MQATDRFDYAERRLQQVSNPATITVESGDVIATPITPVAPYSQAALQCNVSGDSRIPGCKYLLPRVSPEMLVFACPSENPAYNSITPDLLTAPLTCSCNISADRAGS